VTSACGASSAALRDARVLNLLDFVALSSHLDAMGITGMTDSFAWTHA